MADFPAERLGRMVAVDAVEDLDKLLELLSGAPPELTDIADRVGAARRKLADELWGSTDRWFPDDMPAEAWEQVAVDDAVKGDESGGES